MIYDLNYQKIKTSEHNKKKEIGKFISDRSEKYKNPFMTI